MATPDPADSRNPVRLLLHVPVPWVFILCYLVGLGLEYAFPASAGGRPPHAAWSIAGGVLLGLGVIFAGWSLLIFFRSRTRPSPARNPTGSSHGVPTGSAGIRCT
ncbi:MAG TPA: hypothetical protein VMD31_02255 [Opitutaceae bacterium]|nr:hypothetical protein [Opitutaceae bacterium]